MKFLFFVAALFSIKALCMVITKDKEEAFHYEVTTLLAGIIWILIQ